MTASTYPELADFMAAWFHQDFDIEGETVADVVRAFQASTPTEAQAAVRKDIVRFLLDHAGDLDASFESTFQPDVIASAFSGSTRAFLEEIRDLLPASQ
jgi:hypothetical protein